MEQHLGNTTSTTFWNHARDLWKSPRGTVIRIEALAMVAIALCFFLAAFGSCRRSSNRFIIQKGILAAGALSLSLGTYCIGIMQSSPVKSEMYPIWAVSLLTLFGSIDSITGYSLDYGSQFLKLVFQLCLYCGYVLLIGISTISSDVGNIAVGVLCAISLIKGFHRSLSCVLMSRLRNVNKLIADYMEELVSKQGYIAGREEAMRHYPYVVDWPLVKPKSDRFKNTMEHILANTPLTDCQTIEVEELEEEAARGKEEEEERLPVLADNDVITIDKIWHCNINSPGSNTLSYNKYTCLSFALSHLLLRRFFGFQCAEVGHSRATSTNIVHLLLKEHEVNNGFERAFKVIEVELGFLYDLFFTNNAFLHYHESKAATFWTFASIASIIFVGVATVIPGTRTRSTSGGTVVVKTAAYDIFITVLILASLVLLHVLQLIRFWTSNWARVAFMCRSVRNGSRSWRVRLKEFLCRINWFDNHLWQNKLGQYSIIESMNTRESVLFKHVKRPFRACATLSRVIGLQYIEQIFQEIFGSHTGDPTEVSKDVKAAIVHHLMHSSLDLVPPFVAVRRRSFFGKFIRKCRGLRLVNISEARKYPIRTILGWHIATCHLEMDLCHNNRLDEKSSKGKELKSYVGVATNLSKYLVYLIVSAPQLLPESTSLTRFAYDAVVGDARLFLQGAKDKYERMRGLQQIADDDESGDNGVFLRGVSLGKHLGEREEDVTVRWRFVAEFWTMMLFHVTPSDNVKEHIERLARGGEFITHLWALLFHAGHKEWGSSGYFSEDCDEGGALAP